MDFTAARHAPLAGSVWLRQRAVPDPHMTELFCDELLEPSGYKRRAIVSHQKRQLRQWAVKSLSFLAGQF